MTFPPLAAAYSHPLGVESLSRTAVPALDPRSAITCKDRFSSGYVNPAITTEQNSSKSLYKSGCGPDTDSMSLEMSTSSSTSVGVLL